MTEGGTVLPETGLSRTEEGQSSGAGVLLSPCSAKRGTSLGEVKCQKQKEISVLEHNAIISYIFFSHNEVSD